MEKMKNLKDKLLDYLTTYIENNDMESVCAAEMGEVVDMIKDLSESIYYCSVVKAMEENPEQINEHMPIVTK